MSYTIHFLFANRGSLVNCAEHLKLKKKKKKKRRSAKEYGSPKFLWRITALHIPHHNNDNNACLYY